jgi:RimJ/RimL family protein N-acetyltransferase
MEHMQIVSQRLILRPWEDSDRPAFAELSADGEVMAHLMPLATREASDAWIDRQIVHLSTHGFCFWAVESKEAGTFVGAVGLFKVSYTAHFTPAVEVGWRISRPFWGQGYAPEAAEGVLRFGFEDLRLQEIVANASAGNTRSQRVMTKLGMSHDAEDDFDHPLIPEDNPLRRQVLYRLTRDRWL